MTRCVLSVDLLFQWMITDVSPVPGYVPGYVPADPLLHIRCELIQHLSEVCLLRDRYFHAKAARSGAADEPPRPGHL